MYVLLNTCNCHNILLCAFLSLISPSNQILVRIMKVIVKSSTMVTPNAMTPSGNMWITNLDLMATTNYHTRWIYFFPHNGAPNFFDSEVLKAALSRALVEFYPMAGRLTTDENGRIAINCNAQGALFVEAKCDEEIDDLGGFGPRPDLNLNPTADYSKGISSFPLSMIQVHKYYNYSSFFFFFTCIYIYIYACFWKPLKK